MFHDWIAMPIKKKKGNEEKTILSSTINCTELNRCIVLDNEIEEIRQILEKKR